MWGCDGVVTCPPGGDIDLLGLDFGGSSAPAAPAFTAPAAAASSSASLFGGDLFGAPAAPAVPEPGTASCSCLYLWWVSLAGVCTITLCRRSSRVIFVCCVPNRPAVQLVLARLGMAMCVLNAKMRCCTYCALPVLCCSGASIAGAGTGRLCSQPRGRQPAVLRRRVGEGVWLQGLPGEHASAVACSVASADVACL